MITLSSDSLKGYGLNRIFRFVKEAGYDGLDLVLNPKDYDSINVAYIKELSDAYKLPVTALQTPGNASQKQILAAVEMAKELGSKIIVVQAPKIFNFKYTKWLTAEVPKIRQKEQISIALENAPAKALLGIIPEHALNNLNELRKFKHAALDTTRVAEKKDDLIRVYKGLAKFLVHVHVSNVKRGKGYQLPDEGILPLESFFTKLKQDGYKGAISFKIAPKYIQAGDDEKVIKHLKECKDFYEEYFVNIKA
ncbi:hypothetical protein COV82_04625 [Candidatus Peregrinibacteria bacterium CG11_big_fil_rev_8_21_14_0_20_46_8]|nr:MAG: hypothetical protein COV82_04625 [Candidatus Peregrinibacteria bacterium CG11_big_fil_rev_8_21_14_0_20_46_8]